MTPQVHSVSIWTKLHILTDPQFRHLSAHAHGKPQEQDQGA